MQETKILIRPLFICLAVFLSFLSMKAQGTPVYDNAAFQQNIKTNLTLTKMVGLLKNLNNQINTLINQNKKLVEDIDRIKTLKDEEISTKKAAPNSILVDQIVDDFYQHIDIVRDLGSTLIKNVNKAKNLSSSDKSNLISKAKKLGTEAIKINNQIRKLLSANTDIIPANERMKALEMNFDRIKNIEKELSSLSQNMTIKLERVKHEIEMFGN